MHQAARLAPGVTIRGYASEDPEDVVWGAEQFAKAQGITDQETYCQVVDRAINFIAAGGVAIRVMVDMW